VIYTSTCVYEPLTNLSCIVCAKKNQSQRPLQIVLIFKGQDRVSGVEYTYDVSEGDQSGFDRRFSLYWHFNAIYWTSNCLRCSFPLSFIFNKITFLYLNLSSNWRFSQIAHESVIYYSKKFLEINKNFRNFSRNISEENAEYMLVSKNMCSDYLLRRENLHCLLPIENKTNVERNKNETW